MTGKPEFDICTEDYLKNINDPEKKLAMERRKLLLEKKVVKKEKNRLKQMIEKSISDAEKLFPKVALQIAYGHSSAGQSINAVNLRQQKISGEEALILKNQDNRVYSGAGRYDELGRFILIDDLKTKAGMVSAEYAQAVGKIGVKNEFQMINSYELEKQFSITNLTNTKTNSFHSYASINSVLSSTDSQRKIKTSDNITLRRSNSPSNQSLTKTNLTTDSIISISTSDIGYSIDSV